MSGARPARRVRRGFTILETLLAITILVVSLLGMAEFGRRFAHANGIATLQHTATDLSSRRVEWVKAQPTYAAIDSCAATENNPIDDAVTYSRFRRVTTITRTNTAQMDYKTITVTITHPQLPAPVTKTTAIAAF
jgi:Tfp pilus assembly protein PilV